MRYSTKKRAQLLCAALLGLVVAGCGSGDSSKTTVDTILHNGKVLTVDKDFSIAQAVAVKGDRVVAVGSSDSLLRDYSAPTMIDLKGRVAMPGFNDTHHHIVLQAARAIDPSTARSIPELQEMVRAKAREMGPGEWVTGFGWDESNFVEKRTPTRADLDAAAPANPVALTRIGGHSVAANSLAFKAAGIGRDTPDPADTIVERGPDGEPSGIVREGAGVFYSMVPPETPAQQRPGVVRALRKLPALGITSMTLENVSLHDEVRIDPGVASSGITRLQLRSIYDEFGTTLPRVYANIAPPGPKALAAYPYKTGHGDLYLKLGAVGENPFVDGGLSGLAAWTTYSYAGQPDYHGHAFFDEPGLRAHAESVAASGWQLSQHTVGDAAINLAAKVYAETVVKYGLQKARWSLAHISTMPSAASLDLMRANGILARVQPNFLNSLEARYREIMGDERAAKNAAPIATLRDKGVVMAFGTDVIPLDPRVGLHSAVTRKGRSGRVLGPQEAISMQEAIRYYTAAGAYFSFEENEKGTLEAGKLADIIVLDRDPLTVPPDEVLAMNVDLTLIGGRVVHDRLAPANAAAR